MRIPRWPGSWLAGLAGLALALAPGGARAEREILLEEAAEPVQVPGPPPDFELRTPQLKPLKLSALRKAVTVLFAWTPDCAACVGQLGHLQALHQKLKADGQVAVISVVAPEVPGAAGMKSILQVAREQKLLVPLVVDHQRRLTTWLSQAATAEDGRRVSWILPLLVVADKEFHVYHVWGLSPDTSREDWLSEVARVVGLAKRGELPDSPPMPSAMPGEATEEAPGGAEAGEVGEPADSDQGPERARFPFPRKLEALEIEERLPVYRDYLREQYSRLTRAQLDELMVEFRKQLLEGRSEVVLEIPAGVTEVPAAP
jgi:peroxiredoxin